MTQESIGEIACGLYLVVFAGYLWYIDKVNRDNDKITTEDTSEDTKVKRKPSRLMW